MRINRNNKMQNAKCMETKPEFTKEFKNLLPLMSKHLETIMNMKFKIGDKVKLRDTHFTGIVLAVLPEQDFSLRHCYAPRYLIGWDNLSWKSPLELDQYTIIPESTNQTCVIESELERII